MKQLQIVSPAELPAAWPRVRERLGAIESPDGWLVEDVYMALRMNGASLYLIVIEGEEAGVLVLRTVNDFDGTRLHIWLLQADADVDVMAEFSDDIDAIARSVGAPVVTFGSTRPAWSRVAPRYGFALRETVFQRKVK